MIPKAVQYHDLKVTLLCDQNLLYVTLVSKLKWWQEMFTLYRCSLGTCSARRSSLSMLEQFCTALFRLCDSHLFRVFPQGLVQCYRSRPFTDWLVLQSWNSPWANPPCTIWNEIRMPTTLQYGLLFFLNISLGKPLFILVNDSRTCMDQLLGGDVVWMDDAWKHNLHCAVRVCVSFFVTHIAVPIQPSVTCLLPAYEL